MKSKDGINLRESQQDGDERHRTLTLTRERFNTCRTLQRNFQACCEAAKSSQEPADRMRHNEPHGVSPWEPDCRDLGYITRDMAQSIESFSMEMARLSGKCFKDLNRALRTPMDLYETPMDLPWTPLDSHGTSWIPMVSIEVLILACISLNFPKNKFSF